MHLQNGTKPMLAADVSLEELGSDSRCDGFTGKHDVILSYSHIQSGHLYVEVSVNTHAAISSIFNRIPTQ